MRKLKLDLDALHVDTFDAGDRTANVGTVRANMPFKLPATDDTGTGGGSGTDWTDCDCPTYRKTCMATCGIDYCTDVTCLTYDYCCP